MASGKPAVFSAQRVLAPLNVFAVGCALAGSVSATLGRDLHAADAIGASTLLVGVLWAALLRRRQRVGKVRIGWFLSAPLAMLNAGLSLALITASKNLPGDPTEPGMDVAYAFLMGSTAGALIWFPALLVTLVCFGLPLAWAETLAKKGLAGEERGEWIIGSICVLASLAGFAVSRHPSSFTVLLLILGLLLGGTSATLALGREFRRRAFVREARDGKIAGFRVDSSDEGQVLVRVISQGEGYRVANYEEEVFKLEASRPSTDLRTAKDV